MGVLPRKAGRNLGEALKAECIRIATTTALPEGVEGERHDHRESNLNKREDQRRGAAPSHKKKREMPRSPHDPDADGRNPGWQRLLQAGLKKTAPPEFFKEWSAKKVVVEHGDPYPRQGGQMPMPCSRISRRKEHRKQDKETEQHEQRTQEKPDHLWTILR